MADKYNVIRRDYFGDPGKLSGAGLTKDEAETYAKAMRETERAAFEVVPAKKG